MRMPINVGDIVKSSGRIATQQDGRKRYAEFEAALVLEIAGPDISVNPVGKRAKLICQADDLDVTTAAAQPAAKSPVTTLKSLRSEPEPAAEPEPEPTPAPKPERKRVVNKPARRRRKP
jgi:hypothetical protein